MHNGRDERTKGEEPVKFPQPPPPQQKKRQQEKMENIK